MSDPKTKNAEVIEKIKAEDEAKKKAAAEAARKKAADDEAAKLEAAEAKRIAAQQEEIAGKEPELTGEAKAAAEKVMKADRDEDDIPVNEPQRSTKRDDVREEAYARGQVAAKKLKLIAMSYPLTTPDEHVIFGFGGHVFRLGDLRDLMNTR